MVELTPEAEVVQLRRQCDNLEGIVDEAVEAHQHKADECDMWRERAEALRRRVTELEAELRACLK